jgi:hypothetical protein
MRQRPSHNRLRNLAHPPPLLCLVLLQPLHPFLVLLQRHLLWLPVQCQRQHPLPKVAVLPVAHQHLKSNQPSPLTSQELRPPLQQWLQCRASRQWPVQWHPKLQVQETQVESSPRPLHPKSCLRSRSSQMVQAQEQPARSHRPPLVLLRLQGRRLLLTPSSLLQSPSLSRDPGMPVTAQQLHLSLASLGQDDQELPQRAQLPST